MKHHVHARQESSQHRSELDGVRVEILDRLGEHSPSHHSPEKYGRRQMKDYP